MLKVAVASSDGVTINDHFGQARQFLIFDVEEDGTHRQVTQLEILPAAVGEEATGYSHEAVVAQLTGVDAVFANQIGPGATESLQAKGIKSFAVRGFIDKALTSYGKRHKLLDQPLPGVSHSCGSGGGCGGGKGRGGCR